MKRGPCPLTTEQEDPMPSNRIATTGTMIPLSAKIFASCKTHQASPYRKSLVAKQREVVVKRGVGGAVIGFLIPRPGTIVIEAGRGATIGGAEGANRRAATALKPRKPSWLMNGFISTKNGTASSVRKTSYTPALDRLGESIIPLPCRQPIYNNSSFPARVGRDPSRTRRTHFRIITLFARTAGARL